MKQVKKLRDIAIIAAGQGAPQGDDNYCDNGTPFIKAGNLVELLNGKKESEVQKVSENVAKEYKLKLYPAGTVLFAKSGMSCMKSYVYQLKMPCYVVSHLACITPTEVAGECFGKCCRQKHDFVCRSTPKNRSNVERWDVLCRIYR